MKMNEVAQAQCNATHQHATNSKKYI